MSLGEGLGTVWMVDKFLGVVDSYAVLVYVLLPLRKDLG